MAAFVWGLVEKRKTEFGYDPRIVIDFKLTKTGSDSYHLNVSGSLLQTENNPLTP
jgi:hypothetical protein